GRSILFRRWSARRRGGHWKGPRSCRKDAAGLLLRAASAYRLPLSSSQPDHRRLVVALPLSGSSTRRPPPPRSFLSQDGTSFLLRLGTIGQDGAPVVKHVLGSPGKAAAVLRRISIHDRVLP